MKRTLAILLITFGSGCSCMPHTRLWDRLFPSRHACAPCSEATTVSAKAVPTLTQFEPDEEFVLNEVSDDSKQEAEYSAVIDSTVSEPETEFVESIPPTKKRRPILHTLSKPFRWISSRKQVH